MTAAVALLTAILLPVHARTSPTSKASQCMNNLKQLQISWLMYAQDNTERIPNNFGTSATQTEINNQTYRNWANNIMSWDNNSVNTNLNLIRNGVLFPFLGGNLTACRCPTDKFASSIQKSLGWVGRARSISMNGCLGAPSPGWNKPNGDSFNQNTRQWYKTTEIPRPSWFWALVEEHPDSINDGRVLNDIAPYLSSGTIPSAWSDFPATHHEGGSAMSFPDGHVEFHKWRTTQIRPVIYTDWNPTVDTVGRDDIAWYYAHTGVLTNSF